MILNVTVNDNQLFDELISSFDPFTQFGINAVEKISYKVSTVFDKLCNDTRIFGVIFRRWVIIQFFQTSNFFITGMLYL